MFDNISVGDVLTNDKRRAMNSGDGQKILQDL